MKTVLLIRHAKSDWSHAGLSDFERPLNTRGKNDAPRMAAYIHAKKVKIEHILSSPAVRALSTAQVFKKVFDVKNEHFTTIPELYHPAVEAFYTAIEALPETVGHIAVFSHNPGITEMINSLQVARLDNMPTCAVFGFRLNGEWKDLKTAPKEFLMFEVPKLLP